jgi:hypothetical protein
MEYLILLLLDLERIRLWDPLMMFPPSSAPSLHGKMVYDIGEERCCQLCSQVVLSVLVIQVKRRLKKFAWLSYQATVHTLPATDQLAEVSFDASTVLMLHLLSLQSSQHRCCRVIVIYLHTSSPFFPAWLVVLNEEA